ncbi:hypothetical protein NQZ68_010539 [Dissostichus eleginoides]|nr:hypothetical protein NQZ68_010539 [Dissostichus eleginoides]
MEAREEEESGSDRGRQQTWEGSSKRNLSKLEVMRQLWSGTFICESPAETQGDHTDTVPAAKRSSPSSSPPLSAFTSVTNLSCSQICEISATEYARLVAEDEHAGRDSQQGKNTTCKAEDVKGPSDISSASYSTLEKATAAYA